MILHRYNVIATVMLSLVLRGNCDEMEPKSSIAFVIDITLSMEPVIEKVRSSVEIIFDAVTSSSESPIENFVLVLFADPNVTEPLITKDRKLVERTLETVKTEDGDLCPEKSMTGIHKAVNASLPGSYIYVFTDATADDHKMYDEVERSAQEKYCQIVFVLTGTCQNRTELSEDYIVYTKLAEATSGQVFQIKKEDDIKTILEYVKLSTGTRRINLFSKRFPPSKNNTIEVPFDSTMDDLTVAISITELESSAHINATITTPEYFTLDEMPLVKLGHVLIMRDLYTVPGTPGKYNIQFYCNVTSYVIVTARSSVRFRHGFSSELVSTMDSTVIGPIQATKNYLYIKLFGENVRLTAVELLSPDYKLLLNLTLKVHDEEEKIYATELFDPPLSKFRISVVGVDDEDNLIRRFGNLVLETEKPRLSNITITGETLLEYNGTLYLNCTVEAFPEARIVWKSLDDGKTLPSRIGPENSRVLDLESRHKNESFGCYAENAAGKISKTVEVEVEPEHFIIIQDPKGQILDYNAEGVLQCKVYSYPSAEVSWKFSKQKVLEQKKYIVISPDNSTLTIKHMTKDTRGVYACSIKYLNNFYIKQAKVDWSATIPIIDGPSVEEYDFDSGTNIDLTCRLIEGNPEPTIKWFHKWTKSLSTSHKELIEYRNLTNISIKRASELNTGTYTCIARNVLDRAIKYFIVDFKKRKPTVKLDTTEHVVVNESIVVKHNAQFDIKCIVKGTPTPNVVWLKDDEPILIDKVKYRNYSSLTDHSLRLFKADADDTGTYTCKAENIIGHENRSVDVIVYYLKVMSPVDTEYTVERYENIYLPCGEYIQSFPEPNFNWIFYSFDKTVHSVLPTEPKKGTGGITLKNGNLKITKVSETQRGLYTCVAGNIGEAKNITFKVDVQFSPDMLEKVKRYTAVVGDPWLKIYCNVTGNPEPTVDWTRNGVPLAKVENKVLIDNKLIIVQNVTSEDNGDYFCTAKSKPYARRDGFGTVTVTVKNFPPPKSIKTTTHLYVEVGSTQTIECNLNHTLFDTVRWYTRHKLINYKNTLELFDANTADEGTYTCRVSKLDSSEKENANIMVHVGHKPKFISTPRTKFEIYSGHDVNLNCKASGDRKLRKIQVSWKHNGKKKECSSMNCTFKMDATSVGKYECNVTNVFGPTVRTFDVDLKP